MRTGLHLLTAAAVTKKTKPGLFADGGGLYLKVNPPAKCGTVAKSWVFRFKVDGKTHKIGLGSLNTISLSRARELALALRERRQAGVALVTIPEPDSTFRALAEKYIHAHKASWRNPKHQAQWRSTLATFAYPVFGERPVSEIDTRAVLQVIEPIWGEKTETADRVRTRIEKIIDYAKSLGLYPGENPARLKGKLEFSLAKKSKIAPVEHFPALAHTDMPAFMAELRSRPRFSYSALALEWLILTASRTGPVRMATWAEIDIEGRVWNVPAGHMKGNRPHSVPLSGAAMAILAKLEPLRENKSSDLFLFGGKAGLSDAAMASVLDRMNPKPHRWTDLTTGKPVTPHGFRSSFRNWASVEGEWSTELKETALAHTVRNKVEAAYFRDTLVEKRRLMMDAWSSFLG